MHHREKDKLLSMHQFGFRVGIISVSDISTALNHKWFNSTTVRRAARVLAVAIVGVFDKVSHTGILDKFRAFAGH